MKTILWLSRHPMGDDQLKDLEKLLGCKVKVIAKTIREDGEAIITFVHLKWTHVGLYGD